MSKETCCCVISFRLRVTGLVTAAISLDVVALSPLEESEPESESESEAEPESEETEIEVELDIELETEADAKVVGDATPTIAVNSSESTTGAGEEGGVGGVYSTNVFKK